jgi:hypothetical protein
MLTPTSAIMGAGLGQECALITDGRFSGGSHGFVIGHVTPEAQVRAARWEGRLGEAAGWGSGWGSWAAAAGCGGRGGGRAIATSSGSSLAAQPAGRPARHCCGALAAGLSP